MKHKLNTIIKISTVELKQANWKLNINKKTKREHPDWYVRIGESQLTRWIQELTGKHDDFIPELVSVVMKNKKDYDKANKGFFINGVKYRREGFVSRTDDVFVYRISSENDCVSAEIALDVHRNGGKKTERMGGLNPASSAWAGYYAFQRLCRLQ